MRALLPALLLAAALPAQIQTHACGYLVKESPLSICAIRATHKLECSNLRLDSTAVNLAAFENQWVRVEGTLLMAGSVCTTMQVAKIAAATEHGEAGGSWTPGGMGQITIYGLPSSLAVLLLSPGKSGFTPLGGLGLLFVPVSPLFTLGFGAIGGGGSWPVMLPIPNDPALRGLALVFQPALAHLPTMTSILANALCVKIQ